MIRIKKSKFVPKCHCMNPPSGQRALINGYLDIGEQEDFVDRRIKHS